MLDYLNGREAWEIVERDDGFFGIGAGPELYFAEFEQWRSVEQEAMSFAAGRILDVRCGAGRAVLHLQRQGHDMVGIDSSPKAIEVPRELVPLWGSLRSIIMGAIDVTVPRI